MLALVLVIRILVLFAISALFAFFDIFNNRNIPNVIAYLGLAAAVVLFIMGPTETMPIGLATAAFFGSIGYLLYISGQLGAGDMIEFIIIALILPVQPTPILINTNQFALPFMFSVFINAGVAAILIVPIIYLVDSKRAKEPLAISKNNVAKSIIVFSLYLAFALMLVYLFGVGLLAIAFILLIAVASAAVILFERTISKRMVAMVYPKDLEEGDIIEVKLMKKSEVNFFASKSKNFGRLANKKLINDIRGVNRMLPVYRQSVPFAFFLFVGVMLSLAFGNIILLLI